MNDAAMLALVTFVPALAASAILTPLARRVALKANLVAAIRPDGLHREPRPYGGGIAIAATLAVALAVATFVPQIEAAMPSASRLALGGLLFFVIGLIDDRWALRALPKLALQFLAAGVAVLGFGVSGMAWLILPGLPEAASILWIVAAVNAVNLFDHADGLAGTACLVAFAALAAGQILVGQIVLPGMALVAAGAVAGFLIYNRPPARLFLGDAGSSLLGYLFAGLTLVARYWWGDLGTSDWVVLVPVAILAVPLFDAACALGSRLAQRQSPLAGDATSHLAHRLLARGWRPWTVVLFAAAVAAVAGAGSVAMYAETGLMLVVGWGAVTLALVMVWLARRPGERGTGGQAASGTRGPDGSQTRVALAACQPVLSGELLARWLRRGCIVLGAAGLLVLPQVACNVAFAWGVAGAPGPVFALTLGLGFWLVPILLVASWSAERRIVLPHPWLLVPAALAVAAVAISTAAADDKSSALVYGAQAAGLWIAMAAVAQALRSDGERRFLLACLVAVAGAAAVLAVQQAGQGMAYTWHGFQERRPEVLVQLGIQAGSWRERAFAASLTDGVQASLVRPDVLAALLVMGFFAAAGLSREKWTEVRTRAARALAVVTAAVAAISAVGVFLSQSFAGEAALIVGAYWLAVAWWVKRKRLRMALYVLPLVVGAAGLAAAWQLHSELLRYRLEYWQSTLDILRTNWLAGVGLENFGPRYVEFKLPQAPEEISDAHNLLLSVWSKLGLAGLAALVALGLVAIRAWRRPPHPAFGHPLPPLGERDDNIYLPLPAGGERDGVRGYSSTEGLPSLLGPVAAVAGPAVMVYYLAGGIWGMIAMAGMVAAVAIIAVEDPARMVIASRPLRSVRTACIVGLAALVLMEQIGSAALELPTLWAMLILVVASLRGGGHCGLRIEDCGLETKQGSAGDAVSSIRNPQSAIRNVFSFRLGTAGAFGLMIIAMAIGFGYVRGLLVPVIREDALIAAAFGNSDEPRSVFDIDEAMQAAARANPVAWEPEWILGRVWQQTAAGDKQNPAYGISLDKAEEAYREALRRRPRFRRAYLALAECALQSPDADRNPAALRLALDRLREALRLYPTNIPTLRRIGDVEDLLGDYPAAVRSYREALRLDDLLPPDYRRLGPDERREVEGRVARLESRPDIRRQEPLAPPPAGP